ncbi:MAG: hypothetical protein H6742_18570 [Alphaproteobacteria bacterium]|nr:hypothetical protein [Alphaproteobacteria bacterium]
MLLLLLPLLAGCTPKDPGGDGGVDDSGASTDTSSTDTSSTGTDTSSTDSGGPAAVQLRFDPEAADIFGAPWPTDLRVDGDGHPDLTGFPLPVDIPVIETYLATVGAEVGYPTNGSIWLSFTDVPELAALPDSGGAPGDDDALVLVALGGDAAGERVPVVWTWTEDATSWTPDHLLSVAAVPGFPLRPATPYALVVRADVAAPAPAFTAALADDAHFAALRGWLADQGWPQDEVAGAAVFTTTDPLAWLRAARGWVDAAEAPDLSQHVEPVAHFAAHDLYLGRYDGPVFQEGERPYELEGGGLVLDADPGADPVDWDDMRLVVAVPHGDTPAAGWPVVVYQHGTDGDAFTCSNDESEDEEAAVLARHGVATLCIDLPLHGERLPDGVVLSGITHPYNFLNPAAARSVLRQGAIDLLYLVHALAAAPPVLTRDDGAEVRFDPARIGVMGHSQGGLSVDLAAPALAGEATRVVSSGSGGGVALTLLDRAEPFSLQEALAGILRLDEDEVLDEHHPVPVLIQWLSEVTDPINGAPYTFARTGMGSPPVHVLRFSGLLDPISSYRIAESLAAATGTPPLAPAVTSPASWTLSGLSAEEGPLSDNVVAFDGTAVTAGLVQVEDAGHGAIYSGADIWEIYGAFFGEAEPVITRP